MAISRLRIAFSSLIILFFYKWNGSMLDLISEHRLDHQEIFLLKVKSNFHNFIKKKPSDLTKV